MPKSLHITQAVVSGHRPLPPKALALTVAVLLFVMLSGCARDVRRVERLAVPPERAAVVPDPGLEPTLRPYEIFGVRYHPIPDSDGFVEYGDLSWYGAKFHGRPTACGEIYDMYKQSAAHKTLPMGTWVRVINLTNGKEIVVRINDRGPFVKGRILDLSYAAAKELDIIGPGVARGKIIALAPQVDGVTVASGSPPALNVPSLHTGIFSVQVGAFSNRDLAVGLADRLGVLFDDVAVSSHATGDGRLIHRVRVSKSESLTQAETVERRLAAMGFTDAFVVRL